MGGTGTKRFWAFLVLRKRITLCLRFSSSCLAFAQQFLKIVSSDIWSSSTACCFSATMHSWKPRLGWRMQTAQERQVKQKPLSILATCFVTTHGRISPVILVLCRHDE